MGSLALRDMIDANIGMENTLHWHLIHNCFRPINPVFIKIAKQAIELAKEDCWDEEINLEEYSRFFKFETISMSVRDIIKNLHLEEFLVESC